MLVDLRPKNLTGKAAEKILDQAGITVNKNTIPDDPQSPFVTSGIRIGTPAVTTRGMGVGGDAAHRRADRPGARPSRTRPPFPGSSAEVEELAAAFPLYQSKAGTGRIRRAA